MAAWTSRRQPPDPASWRRVSAGRVEIVEIGGAAHFAPWERLRETAAPVRQFLATLR